MISDEGGPVVEWPPSHKRRWQVGSHTVSHFLIHEALNPL